MFPISVTVVPPWVMQTFFTSFSPCSFPIWTHTISTWIILNVCFWVWSKTNTEISHLEELQKNCNGTLKFTVVLQYVTTSSLTQRRRLGVFPGFCLLCFLLSQTPFFSCCEEFLSDKVRGCGTSPSLLTGFPSFPVWTNCCCRDKHTTCGQMWLSFTFSFFSFSSFLLLIFQLSNQRALCFCHTASQLSSFAFPPSSRSSSQSISTFLPHLLLSSSVSEQKALTLVLVGFWREERIKFPTKGNSYLESVQTERWCWGCLY